MANLPQSPILDNRARSLVSRVLYSYAYHDLRHAPLNAFEGQVVKHQDTLRALDKELDEGLLNVLDAAKPYVGFKDGVLFLVTAFKGRRLDDALLILRMAQENKRTLDEAALKRILKASKTMPTEWAVLMMGEETRGEGESSSGGSNSSSLDLKRLRDFK